MKERIFFDNNATTKIADQVLQEMIKVYAEPLNSASIHYFGRTANRICNNARKHVQKLLNADNFQVIFTSGGTESNNLALLGFKDYHIITSAIEHPCIYNLATKYNADIIKVDGNGVLDLADLEEKLKNQKSKNFIVSVMLANNETGALQPIKEIAKLTHQYGGLCHSDIIQAVGKMNIDLEDLNVDMASVSSHKLNGPQGVGVLLVRKTLDISPILSGSAQEGGKRPGTVNSAGAAGIGEACRIAVEKISKYQNSVKKLRDDLENTLKSIAGNDCIVISEKVERLPNTSYIAMKGVDNQTQLIDFDLNGIAVSVGSACSSGSSKPSRILGAMNVDDNLARNVIRVSLGLDNTKEEVEKFVEVWGNLYRKTKS